MAYSNKIQRFKETTEEIKQKPRPRYKIKRPGRKKQNKNDILDIILEQGFGG